MDENEKKNDGQNCCCCKGCRILMVIALLAIGVVIGHVMTMRHHCGHMKGFCGDGHSMKACWDRDDKECMGGFEHKADMGKYKPCCTCPMCLKKAACLSDPNKANPPMMDKKEGKSDKD